MARKPTKTKSPKRPRKPVSDGIRIKGFFRVKIIDPDGSVRGDSGWNENLVTNDGFKLYLADNIGKSAGSKQIAFAALGTGGAPAATDTSLPGVITHNNASSSRTPVTYSNVASKTAQFVGTFASAQSWFTGAVNSNISNIGLFATTSTNETLFCGNTYASSAVASNNDVQFTYQIRFS